MKFQKDERLSTIAKGLGEPDISKDQGDHEEPEREALVFRMDEDGSESGSRKLTEECKSSLSTESAASSAYSTLGGQLMKAASKLAESSRAREQTLDEEEDSDPWDADEFPPLELDYEALKHIATYYLPGQHGRCTEVRTLTRGTYHEIRVLMFEDGWSCIGRFLRDVSERLEKTESEVATINHVRTHTNIPVPEIYFVNFNESHAVGAPFVLMSHLPGKHLYKIWDDMSIEHKRSVISQIADVVAQLATLEFDRIGSLQTGGSIGALHSGGYGEHSAGDGPFETTTDYFLSFLAEDSTSAQEVRNFYPEIRTELRSFLAEQQAGSETLHAPYRLIHGDFDAQNMLFEYNAKSPPKLRGIIDWDYSYTGPLYYLCEYPIFIQDEDSEEDLWDDNKTLRQLLVRCVAQRFPKGSQGRQDIKEAFREKRYELQGFRNIFMRGKWRPELELSMVQTYLKNINGEEQDEFKKMRAYGGKIGWEPDSELESDDE